MNVKRMAIFIFLSLIFSGSLFAADENWRLRKDENGIKVFTRKVEGSPILEFKGVMTADVPPDVAVDFYLDGARYTEWFYRCSEARVLEVRPEGKVFYYVMEMPWPVSDRDSVYLARMLSDKGDVIIRLSALKDLYPLQPGKVRVSELKTEWRFRSIVGGKTEISFQQHTSSDGHIPPALVNTLSVNMPLKTLQKMRTLLLEKKPVN